MVIFFLPHAGGSAKSYSSFKRFLPKELTVVPMELSGRFTRSSEPFLDTIEECTADLIEKHKELLKGDYVLYGHSMGTVLATELVRQVKEKRLPLPKHIFLSGKNPPDEAIHCLENINTASDDDIISFFQKNGLASAPFHDRELMEMLNKILCTDVRMAEKYITEAFDFGCDITVLYGTEDPLMKMVDMSTWCRYTKGKCEVIPFSGDHFFFSRHKEEICRIITDRM